MAARLPSCPYLVVLGAGLAEPEHCKVTSAVLSADIHVATAFVAMELRFRPPKAAFGVTDAVFVLPTPLESMVNDCSVETAGGMVFETVIVRQAEEKKRGKSKKAGLASHRYAVLEEEEEDEYSAESISSFSPSKFKLPFSDWDVSEEVTVRLNYLQPLTFDEFGQYSLRVPLTFGTALDGLPQDVVTVKVALASGQNNTRWDCPSHPLSVVEESELRYELLSAPHELGFKDCDLLFQYTAWADEVQTSLLLQPSSETSGSFLLFLTPPEPSVLPRVIGRKVVILLDRSYSMVGEVWREALDALDAALGQLTEVDSVGVCAFDHEQEWWSYSPGAPRVVPATAGRKESIMKWARMSIAPRGGTDILGPLMSAREMLNASAGDGVPMVLMLTDGAVMDEREICDWARKNMRDIRVFNLGIGFYCNSYFLQLLSTITRGISKSAYYTEHIRVQTAALMKRTFKPVLTDLTLRMTHVKTVELYPNPMPDLFCGSPVILAGNYTGNFPVYIDVVAKNAAGEMVSLRVHTEDAGTMPVQRVFAKQQLDHLVGMAWLAGEKGGEAFREKAVELSTRERIACPFTEMVAYERAPDAPPMEPGKVVTKKSAKKRSKGAVMAIGAGLGLAAFGSLIATQNNLATGDLMQVLDQDAFGDQLLEVLRTIDSCCDCCPGDIPEACYECFEGHEDLLDGCFGDCGDCCEAAGDTCGQCMQTLQGGAESLFSCDCGGCTESLGEAAGSCGDCCATVLSGVVDAAGNCCSEWSGFIAECNCGLDGLGDACGAGAGCLGEALNGVGDCVGGCGELLGGLGECVVGLLECFGGLGECFE
eukprot:PLAT12511.10.p1 GENE.PLAT12511.10~~PLAT12511.10.p1  ORF type:complete len:832 (+),score=302.97 PLAT12511.10:32-2497(+)